MKTLIFLLLCTISWQTMAERLYDVEVIVFKRNQSPDAVKENWPEAPGGINLSNAVSAYDSASMAARGLTLLPKSEWKLNAEYNRLSRHAGFKPLVHVAWRQNDGSRGAMPKMRLAAGNNYGNDYYKDGTPKGGQTVGDDGTEKKSGSMYELDGFIRVYVQHYLFIETDLVLREPGERKVLQDVSAAPAPLAGEPDTVLQDIAQDGDTTNVTAIETPNEDVSFAGLQKLERSYAIEKYLQPYAFEQKRRMRSGEIHYLDHPLMGLIIQVTKAN
ncbi:peptidoglycan binding protein CsiV [Enterovibrio baiacu]|uniref:peptidoglycan binding protein CsiV n=1 Tax=Enterovibrio baiacu TaxID=2491023 RepID=UPI003D118262